MYNIYLRKAAEIYGVTRTRQIYETAIETLKESESRDMCIRFSHAVVVIFIGPESDHWQCLSLTD